MKKSKLLLVALVLFQFSCEPGEDFNPSTTTDIDYQQVSDSFQDMFQGAFNMTDSLEMVTVVDRTDKYLKLRIEPNNIHEATQHYFRDYFKGSVLLGQRSFYPAPPYSTRFNELNASQNFETIVDTASVFNNVQKIYIKALGREILDSRNYSDGLEAVTTFRNKVLNSDKLEQDDKLLLISLSASSQTLLEFFKENGINRMQNSLSSLIGSDLPYGRTVGCSVNWRSVWIGGVVGLTTGAVSGAIAGATVGTVTVPVLGTATGAIGGAVFAGAVGFFSGVVYGVATDLIASCTRDSQLKQNYTSCELAWEAYMNNKTNEIPAGCFEVSIHIKEQI